MLDFTDVFLPMLGFLIIGIIGITYWIAGMIFKARYQKQDAANAAASAGAPPLSADRRDVHLLAVDRTPNGTWEITINGRRYPSLDAVPDDGVRKEVVAGLKEAANFVRAYVQKDQEAKKPPAATTPEVRLPAVDKPVTPPLPAPQTVSPPADKPRFFRREEPALKRSDAAPTIMPVLDLAREIGEIVTEMQARIPSLAQRSIKLQNASGGGVCFAIDGDVYYAVQEIPDADIQALIRAATKEWERR
jgi:hypothetical protein